MISLARIGIIASSRSDAPGPSPGSGPDKVAWLYSAGADDNRVYLASLSDVAGTQILVWDKSKVSNGVTPATRPFWAYPYLYMIAATDGVGNPHPLGGGNSALSLWRCDPYAPSPTFTWIEHISGASTFNSGSPIYNAFYWEGNLVFSRGTVSSEYHALFPPISGIGTGYTLSIVHGALKLNPLEVWIVGSNNQLQMKSVSNTIRKNPGISGYWGIDIDRYENEAYIRCNDGIRRYNSEGELLATYAMGSNGDLTHGGLDIDQARGKLYYLGLDGVLYKSNLDGTSAETLGSGLTANFITLVSTAPRFALAEKSAMYISKTIDHLPYFLASEPHLVAAQYNVWSGLAHTPYFQGTEKNDIVARYLY